MTAGIGSRGIRPAGLTSGLIVAEILIVLGLSLGRSGIYSIVSFLADLTSGLPLDQQAVVLNESLAPGRPLLDLVRQVLRIGFALAPVALVWYLLSRSGEGLRAIGIDLTQPGRDVRRGGLLAVVVGSVGLLGYVVAHRSGANLTVVAQALPEAWWRWPVLVAAAWQNAVLEEVIVLGFVMRRLTQLGWRQPATIATSALVRGSYHLYQGLGGLLGNVAMGVLFGWLFARWGRVMPFLLAHALLDIGAFVGYALLADTVDWLPSPG